MKRITFRLLAAFLTFIIGAAATTFIYLKFFYIRQPLPQISSPKIGADPAESAPLDFCELANNPEKYDGKIVRLSAKLRTGIEGSWFSDPNCGADNAAVVSSSNKEVWKVIAKTRDEKYKTLSGKEKFVSRDLDLTVTGKFQNFVYNEGGLIAPFRFEILSVEKASAD